MTRITLFLFLIFGLLACKEEVTLEDLQKFAAVEVFPEDMWLDTVSNKKALVIVAHDDDDCAMSGTIAKLTAKGWQIKQMSLVAHNDEKTGVNAAPIICLGNELILEDGIYRRTYDMQARIEDELEKEIAGV